MPKITILDLLGSAAVVWGIGLLPAVVTRFLVLKRPVTVSTAAWFSVSAWLLLFFFGYFSWSLVGQEHFFTSHSHGGITLAAFASFYILRKGAVNATNDKPTPSDDKWANIAKQAPPLLRPSLPRKIEVIMKGIQN